MSKPKKPKKITLKPYEISKNVIDLDAYIEHHMKDLNELSFEADENDFNEMVFVVKPTNDEPNLSTELVLTIDESFWDLLDEYDLDTDPRQDE